MTTPDSRPPNILLIMADQWGAADVGCYGSSVPSTPTIDEMAERGVRFDRCYATHPLCGPNRSTMLTGRPSHIHGITANNLELRGHHPTYAHILRAAGYRTGGFGKFHVSSMSTPHPESFDYLGFDEVVPVEDPRLGPWLDWIESEHPEHFEHALATCWALPYLAHYGSDRRDLREQHARARAEYISRRRAGSPWGMIYTSPLPAELQPTTFIVNEAMDFMNRQRLAEGDQPFFCKVSIVAPHDPYDPPTPFDKMYDPADMPPPVGDRLTGRSCEAYQHQRQWQRFGEVGSESVCRQARAAFHGSVKHIDTQIARLLDYLVATGEAERTVVIFTTDHGDSLGDHGLPTKGVVPYDRSIRCPLIVTGPGIEPRTSDELRCTLDFFPTLLDIAGLGPNDRPTTEGRSFAPILDGGDEPNPWDAVTVTYAGLEGWDPGMATIITKDHWRLTRFPGEDYSELFDLRQDPDELTNLADPALAGDRRDAAVREKHADLLGQLSDALMNAQRLPSQPSLPIREDGRTGWPGPINQVPDLAYQHKAAAEPAQPAKPKPAEVVSLPGSKHFPLRRAVSSKLTSKPIPTRSVGK
ncbi:MAG: sulfatase-like hydrolase/transferase [Planctomycetota bacterium]